MIRLPVYDRGTQRFELAAFLCLGLVGVMLVAYALSDAIKFAVARDDIIAALTTGSPTPIGHVAHGQTNVAVSITVPARFYHRSRPVGRSASLPLSTHVSRPVQQRASAWERRRLGGVELPDHFSRNGILPKPSPARRQRSQVVVSVAGLALTPHFPETRPS